MIRLRPCNVETLEVNEFPDTAEKTRSRGTRITNERFYHERRGAKRFIINIFLNKSFLKPVVEMDSDPTINCINGPNTMHRFVGTGLVRHQFYGGEDFWDDSNSRFLIGNRHCSMDNQEVLGVILR